MFFDRCYFCVSMLAALLRALFFTFYHRRAARKQYLCHFIVVARRGNDIFAVLSSPCSAETIFCRFIVVARRGNNIFAVLSSPCSAETISLPFYRRRSTREQYLCHFIVTVQRGNNIFAVLSSPRGAETIFLHFIVCSITASIKIFVFTFAERRCVLENGRGCACVPTRTFAQRRFHTKNTCIVRWEWMMDAPLQGDTGGHTGTAPTKLHHTLQSAMINGHFGHVPAIPFIV